MSNTNKCAVRSCQSENNKLFRCPQSRNQSKKWKSILGVSEKEFYVCELHFDAHFISYEKVLSDEAVPTLFINDKLLVNQYCACCSNPVSQGHQIGQLHLEIHRMLFSNFDLNGEFLCSNCNDKMIEVSDFIKNVEDSRRNFEFLDVELKELVVKIEPLEFQMLIQEDTKEVEEKLFIKSEHKSNGSEEDNYQSEQEEPPPKRIKLSKVSTKGTKSSEFKCEICSSAFDSKNDISDHVFSTHACDVEIMGCKENSNTLYHKCVVKCPECGRKVKYYTYRSHFSSVHSGLRDLMCDQCGKGFAIISSLTNHIKLTHNKTTYVCDICGYKSWNKYKIKMHLNRNHNPVYIKKSKAEAIKCPICFKICSSSLNQHKEKWHPNNYDSGARVNPETNKYHCPNCIQTFASIHHFDRHVKENICSNFEKYEVEDGKKLTTLTPGKFTCNICKSVKPTLVKLRRHITTFHSGERTCLICSKTQKNQKQFLKHVNRFHKLTMKDYKAKATELGHIL